MTELTLEQTPITLDALLALGEDSRIEIINGEWVQKPMAGGEHHIIIGNTEFVLQTDVRKTGNGIVFPDGMTYLMYSDARNLKDSLIPDVSYIRNDNIPPDWDITKPHPGVPDLAIEVVSPNDDPDELQQKRRTYLQKGTQQVWLIYPRAREVHQYTKDGVRIYTDSEAIDAEGLFPGIEGLTLDAIFAMPKRVTKPSV